MTLYEKMPQPDSQRYSWKRCLIKYKLDCNVYSFENWLFSIGIGKIKEIIQTKYFEGLGKQQYIPHFDQIKF